MGRDATFVCLVVFVAVGFMSCGRPSSSLPTPLLREVDWTVKDWAVMSAPEHYIGRIVMLGGEVLKMAYFDDKAVLEVLHLPLSDSNRPVSALRESQGLFVAVANPTALAARLAPGAVVTIVGEVVQADRPGGAAATGTAPRLQVKHLHVWDSTQEEDRLLSSFISNEAE